MRTADQSPRRSAVTWGASSPTWTRRPKLLWVWALVFAGCSEDLSKLRGTNEPDSGDTADHLADAGASGKGADAEVEQARDSAEPDTSSQPDVQAMDGSNGTAAVDLGGSSPPDGPLPSTGYDAPDDTSGLLVDGSSRNETSTEWNDLFEDALTDGGPADDGRGQYTQDALRDGLEDGSQDVFDLTFADAPSTVATNDGAARDLASDGTIRDTRNGGDGPTHPIAEFIVPTANAQPWGITVGPDNNIWFTERAGN